MLTFSQRLTNQALMVRYAQHTQGLSHLIAWEQAEIACHGRPTVQSGQAFTDLYVSNGLKHLRRLFENSAKPQICNLNHQPNARISLIRAAPRSSCYG